MQRGTEVLVEVYGNKKVKRIVWEVLPTGVAVTDDIQYKKMLRGEASIWPGVLPFIDVSPIMDNG